MIILPDKNIPRAKFLMPVQPREWRTPSQAQPKSWLGHENCTRFHVTARRFGAVVWRGWFDDRDDFDIFLWAMATGLLRYDRLVQRLPTPWFDPDLLEYEELFYDFATVSFLVGTSGSDQTDSVPADWNNSNNFIDCIASGGSGAAASATRCTATGGSAGAWSRKTTVSLTPGGSATYRLSAGGTVVTATTTTTAGVAGADCWYGGTPLAGSSVGAKGGLGGNAGTGAGTASGVAGGASGSGVGSSLNSGGASGNATATASESASGGGGAAGPNGNGNGSSAASDNATAGGSGDAGLGGAGGASATGSTGSPTATAGSAGTEYDATHGSGGGGGAATATSIATPTAGGGGLYGAGGGGAAAASGRLATSGAGRQALIMKSYVPAGAGSALSFPNIAMLGF